MGIKTGKCPQIHKEKGKYMWPEETECSTLKMLLFMPHSFSECLCVCVFLCVCGSDEKETSKYISVHFTPHIKQLNVVLVLRLSW